MAVSMGLSLALEIANTNVGRGQQRTVLRFVSDLVVVVVVLG